MAKKQVIQNLISGGIGVLPTDTIYGIVGSALNPDVVAKIYRLRKRNLKKPLIVLISGFADLLKLGIKLKSEQEKILKQIWPGPISVILPCPKKSWEYLHRGTRSLAVRMPKNKTLRAILAQTGPLVAPSANFEGQPPATTVAEAKEYFKNNINFYEDGGKKKIIPSTLIKLNRDKVEIIRKGLGLSIVEGFVNKKASMN